MTITESIEISGGLSKTEKMPCYSWGVPAEECQRGGKLHEIPGTPCSICYAREGRNRFPNVRNAQYRRFNAWRDPRWVDAMEMSIGLHTAIANPYFRWFDTGDLQGEEHLNKIVEIVERLPSIRFWLPTQEYELIRGREFPDNLVVRVSGTWIDGPPPTWAQHTSRIAGAESRPAWAALSSTSTKAQWYCPGELHPTYNCGDCRACWDSGVKTVVYIER